MNDLNEVRGELKFLTETTRGVHIADLAFADAVVTVLKRLDPNAVNTIRQLMDATVPALTKHQPLQTQDAARQRMQAIQQGLGD